MYDSVDTRRGNLGKEISIKSQSVLSDQANAGYIPKIFVVCEQRDTAPVWGYILRQQGLIVILETSLEKAIDHWSGEITDLIVLDIDITRPESVQLYKTFRAVSTIPVLLFLPVYHEMQILEAYAVGVDDVVVKPVSPAVFLAKIMVWVRRSWNVPVDNLSLLKAGKYRLDPAHRCMVDPHEVEIKLTNLEFRLLHVLMSRPNHNFTVEEIIQAIWGGYGNGDQVLLKNVVYRLRKKIEADPSRPLLLQTGQGGYFFHG